jgi:serine/threonine-protein kinase
MEALLDESFARGQASAGSLLVEARPAESYELAPGRVLDGRFEIVELVSRTCMASIFKARDLKSGKTVAIKLPLMECESDPLAYDRFLREEEIALRLDHPDIVKVIPTDGSRSRPYLAMEYLEGERLDQLLARTKPMPEGKAVAVASRLCAAMGHIHSRGIVHRDIKPENIMLCGDGSLRLFDFGIAKASHLRRMTFAGLTVAMGTPDYMAPERVEGYRGDERTDIYSLGAILYEMATGTTPFHGDSVYAVINARTVGDPVAPRQVNPSISPVLEEIILHAMAREPGERYPTVAAMKAELDNFDLVVTTERCRHLNPAAPRNPKLRLLGYIGMFLVLQAIVFGLLYLRAPLGGK